MDELDDIRKVRLTKKLMDEMASRDLSGNRVIWSWSSHPDAEGFYEVSATLNLSDNLAEVAAHQERERLRERDPFGDDWNRPYKMPEKWDTPLELLYHFQEWLLADPSDD